MPQTNTSTLNSTHGSHAWQSFAPPYAEWAGTGDDSASFHSLRGFQNFSRHTVAAIDEIDATTSTSHGP